MVCFLDRQSFWSISQYWFFRNISWTNWLWGIFDYNNVNCSSVLLDLFFIYLLDNSTIVFSINIKFDCIWFPSTNSFGLIRRRKKPSRNELRQNEQTLIKIKRREKKERTDRCCRQVSLNNWFDVFLLDVSTIVRKREYKKKFIFFSRRSKKTRNSFSFFDWHIHSIVI